MLSTEIGAAPTITDLLLTPKALIAYSLGQAYVSFFRLVGPFASKKAGWDVAEGELFEPVVSRGLWANAIFLVTMALFAYLNLLCCVVEVVGERVAPKWVESLRSA